MARYDDDRYEDEPHEVDSREDTQRRIRNSGEDGPPPSRSPVVPILLVFGGLGCVIVLFCAGVIAALAWAFSSAATELPQTQEKADQFLGLLQQNKLPEAYELTSAGFRSRNSQEKFAEFIKQHEVFAKQTSHTTDGFSFSNNQSGKHFTLKVTLRSPNNTMGCTLILVDEGGELSVDQITVP